MPKPSSSVPPAAAPGEPARYAGFLASRRSPVRRRRGADRSGLRSWDSGRDLRCPGTLSTGSDSTKLCGDVLLGSWLVGWLYFALLHSSGRQASLGKRALGIKVTDLNGERISFARASGRYLAYLAVCVFTLGLGLLMAGFTRRRQALHDMIAGTLVVSRDTTPADVAAGLQAPKVSGVIVAVAILVGVIPLIGIMAAISIPAYNDYLIRSQVSEGLVMASAVKASVAEAYANGGSFGDISTESLGLEPSPGKYVNGISVIGGVVIIEYGGEASTALQGKTVLLVPGATTQGDIVWTCGHAAAPYGLQEIAYEDYSRLTDVEDKYLPSSCRK